MGKYDDIINLPHHVSPTRPRMPMSARAAQFSPFAAISGHSEAVRETARLTDDRVELTEEEQSVINDNLALLADLDAPEAAFVYFVPDDRKEGGAYTKVEGTVKRVDAFEQAVILTDGTRIPFESIKSIAAREHHGKLRG